MPRSFQEDMEVLNIYLSAGHNFFGHYGKPPGNEPMIEVSEAQCVAGKGLVGDRFFDYKPDYKGQVTFFSLPVFEDLCREFGVTGVAPSVFRRNVLVDVPDLSPLIGERFAVQGIEFEGTEESKPCFWMNQAFAEGAEEAMKGRAGLRARILSDGVLRSAAKVIGDESRLG